MRAAKTQQGWEGILTRYFYAIGINLRWNARDKRFRGMSGHSIARINPRVTEESFWKSAPEFVRKYEKLAPHQRVILVVASKSYGDNVEDTLVLTRMGTFAPMLKAFIESDKERWNDATQH
jgi:hypothetical protein